MKRYILNSAVITEEGYYYYKRISVEEAIEWLKKGDFESTIGYKETVDALAMLTGISVDVNRKMVKMGVGDEALVFRLTSRLDDPSLKGRVSVDFVRENCEIGILKRIAIGGIG